MKQFNFEVINKEQQIQERNSAYKFFEMERRGINLRSEGYYEVKFEGKWQIGYYNGEDWLLLTGERQYENPIVYSSQLDEIDDKIIKLRNEK